MVKLDDRVLVYGYAKEIRTAPDEQNWHGFFNGVQMQVMEIDSSYGCTTLLCREFDLNQGTIRDFFMHENQVRKVK